MPKPTAYKLITDVHKIVNRIDEKYDKKFTAMEKRVDSVDKKTENMLGQIGIGVMIVSSLVASAITVIVTWFKDRI